jgi:hypothetical protein
MSFMMVKWFSGVVQLLIRRVVHLVH